MLTCYSLLNLSLCISQVGPKCHFNMPVLYSVKSHKSPTSYFTAVTGCVMGIWVEQNLSSSSFLHACTPVCILRNLNFMNEIHLNLNKIHVPPFLESVNFLCAYAYFSNMCPHRTLVLIFTKGSLVQNTCVLATLAMELSIFTSPNSIVYWHGAICLKFLFTSMCFARKVSIV